jgi:hypothetical protein
VHNNTRHPEYNQLQLILCCHLHAGTEINMSQKWLSLVLTAIYGEILKLICPCLLNICWHLLRDGRVSHPHTHSVPWNTTALVASMFLLVEPRRTCTQTIALWVNPSLRLQSIADQHNQEYSPTKLFYYKNEKYCWNKSVTCFHPIGLLSGL